MPTWRWSRFEGLSPCDVYDLLALRARVFVVEQDCAYLDPDGLDRDAWHLLGRDDAGVLRAYLRVVDPGRKYAAPSIGRVVTDPAARGTGLGHALLAEGLRRCEAVWPGAANRIGAQARLQGFYAGHGFVALGDVYIEDDIPHIDMERPGT
jgi:ElaA protein